MTNTLLLKPPLVCGMVTPEDVGVHESDGSEMHGSTPRKDSLVSIRYPHAVPVALNTFFCYYTTELPATKKFPTVLPV